MLVEGSVGLHDQQPADKLSAAECKRSSHSIPMTPERSPSKPLKVCSTTAAHDRDRGRDRRSSPEKISALLHTGGILGDLPSLNTDKIHRNIESVSSNNNNDYVRVLGYGDSMVSEYPTAHTHTHTQGSPFRGGTHTHTLDSRADAKDKNQNRLLSNSNNSSSKNSIKQMKKRDTYVPPEDFPPSYLCELSHRPMSDPVQSIYGNIFDRPTIIGWIRKQGHVCPLSGTCRAYLLYGYVCHTICLFVVIVHFAMYLLRRPTETTIMIFVDLLDLRFCFIYLKIRFLVHSSSLPFKSLLCSLLYSSILSCFISIHFI